MCWDVGGIIKWVVDALHGGLDSATDVSWDLLTTASCAHGNGEGSLGLHDGCKAEGDLAGFADVVAGRRAMTGDSATVAVRRAEAAGATTETAERATKATYGGSMTVGRAWEEAAGRSEATGAKAAAPEEYHVEDPLAFWIKKSQDSGCSLPTITRLTLNVLSISYECLERER